MGCIYSQKENPTIGDFILIWDNNGNTWKTATVADILALSTESSTGVVEAVTQYASPSATGFDIQINTGLTDVSVDTHLILSPASAFADGDITLPSSGDVRDKQKVTVNCTQQVTTFTVNANGASGVYGAPTSLGADDFFTLKYDSTMNSWYRVG